MENILFLYSVSLFCFFILFLYSYHVHFISRNKSKNVLQNEVKDLNFKVSNLSVTFFLKNYFLWGSKHLWHLYSKEVGRS